jgi:hypothetical protein
VFAAGLVASLVRGPYPRVNDRFLQLGLLGAFVWLTMFSQAKLLWYLMSYLPLLAALLGRLVAWPISVKEGQGVPAPRVLISMLGLLVVGLALEPFDIFRDVLEQRRNYTVLTEELRSVIPSESDVAGNGTFYFAAGQRSYKNLLFVQRSKYYRLHGIDFGAYLDVEPATRFLLIDTNMQMDQEMKQMVQPAIASRGGREVESFDHVGYGRVRVYELDRSVVSATAP